MISIEGWGCELLYEVGLVCTIYGAWSLIYVPKRNKHLPIVDVDVTFFFLDIMFADLTVGLRLLEMFVKNIGLLL